MPTLQRTLLSTLISLDTSMSPSLSHDALSFRTGICQPHCCSRPSTLGCRVVFAGWEVDVIIALVRGGAHVDVDVYAIIIADLDIRERMSMALVSSPLYTGSSMRVGCRRCFDAPAHSRGLGHAVVSALAYSVGGSVPMSPLLSRSCDNSQCGCRAYDELSSEAVGGMRKATSTPLSLGCRWFGLVLHCSCCCRMFSCDVKRVACPEAISGKLVGRM